MTSEAGRVCCSRNTHFLLDGGRGVLSERGIAGSSGVRLATLFTRARMMSEAECRSDVPRSSGAREGGRPKRHTGATLEREPLRFPLPTVASVPASPSAKDGKNFRVFRTLSLNGAGRGYPVFGGTPKTGRRGCCPRRYDRRGSSAVAEERRHFQAPGTPVERGRPPSVFLTTLGPAPILETRSAERTTWKSRCGSRGWSSTPSQRCPSSSWKTPAPSRSCRSGSVFSRPMRSP